MSDASEIKQLADTKRENQQFNRAVSLYVLAGQVYSDEGNKRQSDDMFRYANECISVMIRNDLNL
jgi:hypothetical protein